MDLDDWLECYRELGFTINIEEDGGQLAWFVYDEKGELYDWWWLTDMGEFRPLDTIPHEKPGD